MNRAKRIAMGLAGVALAAGLAIGAEEAKKWAVHDRTRPQPTVVAPAVPSTQEQVGKAPSDAIVLFDGKDLSQWPGGKWKVENGYMEVTKGGGNLNSKDGFGSCQLHVEWMAPDPAKGKDQDRGNSGIFFMSRYELQVLDSYESVTYADGMVGSVYGQYPPLVNTALPPGKWQTYDVVFHRPIFDGEKVVKPARMTVLLNGVLVQDNVELTGPTAHGVELPYKPHADKMPFSLQDHGHPVRYRNMWVRPLAD